MKEAAPLGRRNHLAFWLLIAGGAVGAVGFVVEIATGRHAWFLIPYAVFSVVMAVKLRRDARRNSRW